MQTEAVKTRTSSIETIVNHPFFFNIVIGLILLNAVIIGLETYPAIYKPYKQWFYLSERLLLWLFTIELTLRIIGTRPWYAFFRNGWNNFDFIIVASSLLFSGAHFISVLRILRLLRVLRAVSVIPSLQKLVNALLNTIPSLGNIMLLMSLIFYIFGVLGTILFAEAAPEFFGSLHLSLLTLFQVVTLESWASGVMRPLITEVSWAWAYFVSFILIGTFVIINLFVGVIVNNVHQANLLECDKEDITKDHKNNWEAVSDEHKKELLLLRKEIAELKTIIQQNKNKL
ncbi:MAG: ion transporter [Bacillota bacterium]